MERPLKLKAQSAAGKTQPAKFQAFAQIIVNSPIGELENFYTYLVPDNLDELCLVGSLVQITFHNRKISGYVLARLDLNPNPEIKTLRFLDKILISYPLLSEEIISLLPQLALKYGANYPQLVKSLMPEFPIKRNMLLSQVKQQDFKKINTKVRFLFNSNYEFPFSFISEFKDNNLVIFFSSLSEISSFTRWIAKMYPELGKKLLIFHYGLPGKEKLTVLSKIVEGDFSILLSTRSGVFLPYPVNTKLICYEESRFGHQEPNFPFWHTFDLLLLRKERYQIFAVGSLPTIATHLKIEDKEISVWKGFVFRYFTYFFQSTKETEHGFITKILRKSGTQVLIVNLQKGEITAIACQKCRNLARCECGGKLISDTDNSWKCNFCRRKFLEFKCLICGENKIRVIAKGSSRIAVELGKTYPQNTVKIFDSNQENNARITVATYYDQLADTYDGIVFRNLDDFFYRPDFDSEEKSLLEFVSKLNNVKSGGQVFMDINPEHPIARSLAKRTFQDYFSELIRQRKTLNFPPFTRVGAIVGPPEEVKKLETSLRNQNKFMQVNLTQSNENALLVIRASREAGEELAQYLSSVKRITSLRSGTSLQVYLDRIQ